MIPTGTAPNPRSEERVLKKVSSNPLWGAGLGRCQSAIRALTSMFQERYQEASPPDTIMVPVINHTDVGDCVQPVPVHSSYQTAAMEHLYAGMTFELVPLPNGRVFASLEEGTDIPVATRLFSQKDPQKLIKAIQYLIGTDPIDRIATRFLKKTPVSDAGIP